MNIQHPTQSSQFTKPADWRAWLNYIISGPNRKRAEDLVQNILPYLCPGEHILDIGAGRALVADALINRGFDVALVDVADLSYVPHLKPTIYNGAHLPYSDDRFDAALLLTVLHHIPDPNRTLAEARRVAKRIIVLEDIYESEAEKWFTWAGDSWLNWEFAGHPHSNRDDKGWRESFARLRLRVASSGQHIHWFFPFRFRHATYVLDRE